MKEGQPHPEKRTLDACLAENREALSRLAGSGEAKQLMELLGRQGEVRQAAQAAARGDAERRERPWSKARRSARPLPV